MMLARGLAPAAFQGDDKPWAVRTSASPNKNQPGQRRWAALEGGGQPPNLQRSIQSGQRDVKRVVSQPASALLSCAAGQGLAALASRPPSPARGCPGLFTNPPALTAPPPLARPPHRVEFENQSTRPAVIFHKKLTPGESVSVADRGSELCTLSRRPRDLNARAERKAFSLPGGSGGYAAQFTVAIGDVTTGTNVACVIDTTGPNAGKKFKVVVHGALAPLLIDSYMARALTLHASGCRWPRSRAAPLGG